MTEQATTGFLDALGNHLETLGLGLTKGTNLFADALLDESDTLVNQIVLLDAGYEEQPAFRHLHLLWSVRILTARQARNDALEALRPIVAALLNSRFLATSDASESYRVLTVRPVSAPTLTEKLDRGRYLAETTVQLQVIPV